MASLSICLTTGASPALQPQRASSSSRSGSLRSRHSFTFLAAVPTLRLQSRSPESKLLRHSSDFAPLWSGGLEQVRVVSAAYGSVNGNGRPGSNVQQSGEGYSLGFITGEPENTDGQKREVSGGQDFGEEKKSESLSKLRGRELTKKGSGIGYEGDEPYRVLDDGRTIYLDEYDVITLLDPPRFLRPLKPLFYNHAAFLWKKIGDIPEERRHRLLDLLLPSHITKMWEMAGLRYDDPDLFVDAAAEMLPRPDLPPSKSMVWDGRVNQVPWYLAPFSRFQKVFFNAGDERIYGRVITGGKFLRHVSDKLVPLYFQVKQTESVMATEEQCDLLLEYGNGQLHLRDSLLPPGFAKPVKHLPPFNNNACDYLRAVGPGVMVGQSWIEGRKLEQTPRRLYGEFILVQRYD